MQTAALSLGQEVRRDEVSVNTSVDSCPSALCLCRFQRSHGLYVQQWEAEREHSLVKWGLKI